MQFFFPYSQGDLFSSFHLNNIPTQKYYVYYCNRRRRASLTFEMLRPGNLALLMAKLCIEMFTF